MEHKLSRIEGKLMEKEIYNYQMIQDKLEQKRQEELAKKELEKEEQLKFESEKESQRIED